MTGTCPGTAYPSREQAENAKPGATILPHGDHFDARYLPGDRKRRLAILGVPEVRQEARRTVRDTGFSPSIKLTVRTRAGSGDPDQAVCEACGIWLGRSDGEIQHIIARGQGGTSREVINSVINAALLCGHASMRSGCHGRAEKRDPDMYDRGFWRKSSETPGAAPLEMHGRDGGFTRWLTPDGGYSETPSALVAS